jgi:hypothetical protein
MTSRPGIIMEEDEKDTSIRYQPKLNPSFITPTPESPKQSSIIHNDLIRKTSKIFSE